MVHLNTLKFSQSFHHASLFTQKFHVSNIIKNSQKVNKTKLEKEITTYSNLP
jgi:hypothetical protein